MKIKLLFCSFFSIVIFLQGCSGSGFHLRKSVELPQSVQSVSVTNLSYEHGFATALESALENAGGKLLKTSPTKIEITNFSEGKHVVSYDDARKAREYLVYLRFDYTISSNNKKVSDVIRLRLDRSFIYDADFALGKAEEESEIIQGLQEEAARLVMLKLKSLFER